MCIRDRICAKTCRERIEETEGDNYSVQLFLSESRGIYFSFEILNVRAECRESRDLMQDMMDIQNGIRVTHASDLKKRESEYKRARRKKARRAKIRQLEKKILEKGYGNLEECSGERRHADKWLGMGRIAELEKLRAKKEKGAAEEPVQMNLFDWMREEAGEQARHAACGKIMHDRVCARAGNV